MKRYSSIAQSIKRYVQHSERNFDEFYPRYQSRLGKFELRFFGTVNRYNRAVKLMLRYRRYVSYVESQNWERVESWRDSQGRLWYEERHQTTGRSRHVVVTNERY